VYSRSRAISKGIELPHYSVSEEIANSVTHGLGIVLSIAGLAVLTALAAAFGGMRHIVSCGIFGVSLILLYSASTLYHSVPVPRAKAVLRVLDHSAIFLVIAGTYTPFLLVNLSGAWGWTLLTVIWGLAILGIALQKILIRQNAVVTALPYIGMGWLAVIGLKPMLENVAPGGIALLVAGGIAYTVGVLFFVWRRMPFHHAVWHLFVMAGSAFHFFAVLFYVIPIAR
jgi:hemolysin III